MRKLLLLISLLLFFAIVFLIASSDSSAQSPPVLNGGSERLIVKFKPLVPRFYKEDVIRNQGLAISEDTREPDTHVIKVPRNRGSHFASRLKRNLLVEYAEQDFIATKFETPNDPSFSSQWGLTKIQSPGAWDVTHGASNVDIAIIDTGINYTHPDLVAKISASVNCTVSSSCPSMNTTDPDGHGTHVAGIAGALTNNSIGVAGTAWEARLMSVKALDDFGSGYYSWIANAIYWATDNGAEVINMSLGGSSSSDTLRNAVDYAWNHGVVVVAAAGNSGRNRASYPAYYSNAIAVAATDQNDKKASFSNYGSWVDLAAPGVFILSTYHGGYDYLSGTSMSTPFASGLAALLKGQNPGWNNSQIRNQIEQTADTISGTGSYWTHGRINACSAVGCDVGGGGSTPTNTPTPTTTNTPTPTVTPTPIPNATNTPTPSPTPEATPTFTPTPTPMNTPTPTPTPTSSPKPWWCKYVPSHSLCQ